MFKLIKKIFFIVLLFSVLIFSGCNKKEVSEDVQDTPTKETVSKYGGTLKIPVVQVKSLNPFLESSRSLYYFNKLIYESLFEINKSWDINPVLANNISYIDDKTIIVNLKSNIKWHDGHDFTAQDVVFTIDALKGFAYRSDKPSYSYLVNNIVTAKVRNSHSLEIRLIKPDFEFNKKLIFPIISKRQFSTVSNVYSMKDMVPIGTGPYKIKSYEKRNKISLEANEIYWGEKSYINNIEGIYVPSEEAALSMLQSGKADMVEADYYDWDKYTEDENLVIHEFSTSELEFININISKEILSNPSIRKAIYYGINRNEIINNVYLGHGKVLNYPSIKFDMENLKVNPTNIPKALSYIDEIEKKNINLRLLVNNNEERIKSAQSIQKNLKKIGININIDIVNWDDYIKRINSFNYDLVLMGVDLKEDFGEKFLLDPVKHPYIKYKNPEILGMLDKLDLEANELNKEAIRKQIADIYIKDMPYVSLFIRNKAIISSKKIEGISPNLFNIYSNINKWYIKN